MAKAQSVPLSDVGSWRLRLAAVVGVIHCNAIWRRFPKTWPWSWCRKRMRGTTTASSATLPVFSMWKRRARFGAVSRFVSQRVDLVVESDLVGLTWIKDVGGEGRGRPQIMGP